ncbi:methylmalonyl-CoA epimerase [Mesonia aestuariivivens]|uniref:Methylmalonyl-CoA epimerase n=1 Tax=Mesonia aestuariivivens TaxID=2796128 RepID=A0ABS6W191_9FLAO|nr:methylmalonyl-CoA epimerase [Mesonia aestuariivivens]MBW2961597.1 methylmalonyl-CoA epimerase [Mesonia aestuariivivens]
MKKIEHIGIAVKNLSEANALYSKLLGTEPYKEEAVESEGVITSFFKIGETKIELLAATSEESTISKYIEKRGEGIHHIAFYVDDIESEVTRLQAEGFKILNTTPKKGADQKKVVFLHPKSTTGVLIELCENL